MNDSFEKNKIDFGKSADQRDEVGVLEVSEGRPEQDAFFRGNDGDVPIKEGNIGEVSSGARQIDLVRNELAQNALRQKSADFIPVKVETGETNAIRRFAPKQRAVSRFRQWFNVALVSLGIFGANKAQSADLSKPSEQSAGVPVFKAPAVKSADTNVYRYEQPTFKLTPEQVEANKKALKEAYEARMASQKEATPSVTITAQPGFENGADMNQGATQNVNRSQMNYGSPAIERGNGMNYGNYPAQRQNMMNQGGRIVPARDPNFGRQNITYMGGDEVFVPHGVSLPTERRKFGGKEYDAVTRRSVGIEMQVGGQQNRIPPQPRNPRSR